MKKERNLGKINKIPLKCDCIDGSVLNGVRQPILYRFALDNRSGYRVFSRPEAVLYKKLKK